MTERFGPSNPPAQGGGGGIIQQARVTLSSAQLIATAVVPAVLVVAPGPGKMLVPVGVVYSYTFGTMPYTSIGFGGVIWQGTDNFPADQGDGNGPTSLNSGLEFSTPISQIGGGDAEFENVSLAYSSVNAVYTGGDGTFEIILTYYTIDL